LAQADTTMHTTTNARADLIQRIGFILPLQGGTALPAPFFRPACFAMAAQTSSY